MRLSSASQAPFPYAIETCRWAIEIGGSSFIVTHRGVVSSARLLDAHEVAQCFTDCITETDPCPREPESVSLQALVDRCQLHPARCPVVGDRDLDV